MRRKEFFELKKLEKNVKAEFSAEEPKNIFQSKSARSATCLFWGIVALRPCARLMLENSEKQKNRNSALRSCLWRRVCE